MVAGFWDKGDQFRAVSSFPPWKMPQSTSKRLPAASTRYFEPVTVPAAPRNVRRGIGRWGADFYWEPVQLYYDVTATLLSQPFLGHNLITPQGRLQRITLQRRRGYAAFWEMLRSG